MVYIRHCQESNSQPVPSQVRADSTYATVTGNEFTLSIIGGHTLTLVLLFLYSIVMFYFNFTQGIEFAERFSLEYLRLENSTWKKFKDFRGNEVDFLLTT